MVPTYKCKCGRYTTNGFTCTWCSTEVSPNKRSKTDEELELEECGFEIVNPSEKDEAEEL